MHSSSRYEDVADNVRSPLPDGDRHKTELSSVQGTDVEYDDYVDTSGNEKRPLSPTVGGSQSGYYVLDPEEQSRNRDMVKRKRLIVAAVAILFLVLSAVAIIAIAVTVSMIVSGWTVKPLPTEHFANETTVILISIDGFRWDYWDMYNAKEVMPTLYRMREEGVHAKWLNPIFPSKTFPNHYTLVTGLYAESHGIVANQFYDPVTDKVFKLSDPISAESHWWLGEPIWVTSVQQGKPVNCCFWPGCNAVIKGSVPTYNKPYDKSFPYNGRVDRVLELLSAKKKEDVPRLSLTYFEDVDTQGHLHGPGSKQVEQALTAVDNAIARLLDGLEQRNISQYVDVVIVSDHGMASISNDRGIDVTDVADNSEATQYNFGPTADFWSKNRNSVNDPDAIEQLFQSVSKQIMPNDHADVYKRSDIPDKFHFKNHPRVPPVLGVAKISDVDQGWSFITQAYNDKNKGNHGWSPEYQAMKAIFLAKGPSFKERFVSDPLDNVHIYSLLARILDLNPAPTNGTVAAVEHLLK